MKLEQTFTIARPVDAVWAVFQDIPAVAACLPGAEYMGPKGEGRHGGRVSSKIGPFQASFEGEAAVAYDELARSILVDGKGLDRKGGSRGRMTMKCVLTPARGGDGHCGRFGRAAIRRHRAVRPHRHHRRYRQRHGGGVRAECRDENPAGRRPDCRRPLSRRGAVAAERMAPVRPRVSLRPAADRRRLILSRNNQSEERKRNENR